MFIRIMYIKHILIRVNTYGIIRINEKTGKKAS